MKNLIKFKMHFCALALIVSMLMLKFIDINPTFMSVDDISRAWVWVFILFGIFCSVSVYKWRKQGANKETYDIVLPSVVFALIGLVLAEFFFSFWLIIITTIVILCIEVYRIKSEK